MKIPIGKKTIDIDEMTIREIQQILKYFLLDYNVVKYEGFNLLDLLDAFCSHLAKQAHSEDDLKEEDAAEHFGKIYKFMKDKGYKPIKLHTDIPSKLPLTCDYCEAHEICKLFDSHRTNSEAMRGKGYCLEYWQIRAMGINRNIEGGTK